MNMRPAIAKPKALPTRAPAPTLAVRGDQAAEALGISLSTFLSLVGEGQMPKPIPVPNHRGLALYDFKAVENAWRAIAEAAGSSEDNPFDE